MTSPVQGGQRDLDDAWIERMPLATAVIREGRFRALNAAFAEILGCPREQALGMRFDQPVAPEDLERIRDRHRLRLRGDVVPNSYEFSIVRPSGERRQVEVFISTSGEDTILMVHDVTLRVRRLEKLRSLVGLGAAAQRARSDAAIFKIVGDGLAALGGGVVRFAPSGDGVRVVGVYEPASMPPHPAMTRPDPLPGSQRPWTPGLTRAWKEGCAYLDELAHATARFMGPQDGDQTRRRVEGQGWTRGAMVRIDVENIPREVMLIMTDWVFPEDLPALALFGAQINAALDAARTIADFSTRNAQLTALDHVATVAGTAEDLNELFRRATTEVLEVLSASSVALFLVEESHAFVSLAHSVGGSAEMVSTLQRVPVEGSNLGIVITEGSPRTWRAADYGPERQALLRSQGLEVVLSIPMIIRARVVGVMNIAFKEHREITRTELEILLAMAVHMAAAVESNRLVDDLRRSYSELSRTQAQLVQRERLAAIGEMAAAVAHEVRNPLGVIFNSMGSLRRELGTRSSAAPLLAILTEESERINHLVSDLLDFARPTQPVLSSDLPLLAAVREAVESVLGASPTRVELQIQSSGDLEKVAMDARLMRQVFVNLAENAVQAMPQGGRIDISLGRERRADLDLVSVAFRDTGNGIPPAVLPRIFEPFFTTRAKGTGLGLALVKRILEGHHGEIEVRSEPGRGTGFTLRWPLRDPADRS